MTYSNELLILLTSLTSLFIAIKTDQQFVIFLKNRALKKGHARISEKKRQAKIKNIYVKRNRVLYNILFLLGGASMGGAIVLIDDRRIFFVCVICSALLLGAGIFGKIKAFHAADRDLDTLIR